MAVVTLRAPPRLSILFMSSRRAQTWVWLLLPFLVARALMPAGFMAQLHEGKLQIVLCSAGFSKLADLGQGDDQHGTVHVDDSCPFSQAAAAPVLLLNGSDAIPYVEDETFLPPTELAYYAAGPPRHHPARGPPHA